jgi:hypothetical protein|tara:strand:- start:16712 stop:16921 length:210 start_codon:yes stop_codon:yes gene_type:complete
MIKVRGIAIIDYDLPNGYMDAGEEQVKLKAAIDELVKGNPRVVFHAVDVRERRDRGSVPDIKKMKLRIS